MYKFLLLILPLLLAACGSTPAPLLPQAVEQAQDANKDARRALRDGELARAQNDFARALALQQSLDDTDGAAMTLINMATVAHQMHDEVAALIWLDSVLMEKPQIYPPESRMTASFRKAVILTNLARLPQADAALQASEDLCMKTCALRFGMDNLRARLLLLKGDAEGALALAQTVDRQGEAGKEEQANALRISAAAEERLLRHEMALQHYQAALEMDKSLGLSERIGEDLNGMALVFTQLGRNQEAALFARRAELVNASRDKDAAH